MSNKTSIEWTATVHPDGSVTPGSTWNPVRRFCAVLFLSLSVLEDTMIDLSRLEAEVTRNESVDASASTLLKRLFDEVEANKNDPAAIQALVDRVRASNDSLTAAISANTPATPAPPAA